MTKDEALKLALEALEGLFGTAEQFEGGGVAFWLLGGSAQPKQAIAALRLAIDAKNMASESTYKQQTQEPLAWWNDAGDVIDLNVSGRGMPLYTTPPKREWVGLTDEEVLALWGRNFTAMNGKGWLELYRITEAKLKDKNNP